MPDDDSDLSTSRQMLFLLIMLLLKQLSDLGLDLFPDDTGMNPSGGIIISGLGAAMALTGSHAGQKPWRYDPLAEWDRARGLKGPKVDLMKATHTHTLTSINKGMQHGSGAAEQAKKILQQAQHGMQHPGRG